MNQMRILMLGLVTFVLAGCATTGGTIGGLIPAPKFLKGEINNNIYTAQDKSFSVSVPHKQGSYEYKYMNVKEQYSPYGAYVSFGPAAFDQSIYRVETAKRVTPGSQNVKFDDTVPKIIDNYKAQLEKGYGTAPKEVESRKDTINGRKAYYSKLSQTAPAGTHYNNKEAIFTHYVYVIDFDKGAAITWVQIPDTGKSGLDPRAFAESVMMY